MANAPTFQSPILFPREILAFKILQYSRTNSVVRIATDSICFEKRSRNVSFVSLYGLSEKRKNYAPIYSRYNPANNVPNSRTVGINLEDARKRRDLVDSIVFFHGLFSSERKWARTDFAMCSFLCTLVSTSDDP